MGVQTFLKGVIFANQRKIAQSRQLSRESVGYFAFVLTLAGIKVCAGLFENSNHSHLLPNEK